MSTTSGPEIVTDKLSFYIDFANPKSYTSGNSVKSLKSKDVGTIYGTPNIQNVNQGFLKLDGSTNYIDVNGWNNIQTNNKITLEFWGRITQYLNKFQMFFGFNLYDLCFATTYGAQSGFGFNTGNGDVYGISQATAESLNLIGTDISNWHHYVCVFDEVSYANNKLYIDGVQQSLSQIRASQLTQYTVIDSNFRIGGWRYGSGYHPFLDLSLLKLYNKELSLSEIRQNYNAVKSRYIN